MATKIGINGFGRIGRQVIKAIREYYPNELEVVAFNDIFDLKTMAHLLKYDSNYGRFDGEVKVGEDELLIDGKSVKSCTTLAVEADGGKVTTIEGLASSEGDLHPMQAAFREEHADGVGGDSHRDSDGEGQ